MRIRPAESADARALADLFVEMEKHYDGGADPDPSAIAERIARWLARQPDAIVLIAEDTDGGLLGHLSAAPVFPSGAGRSAMFVKDIFVRGSARGRGIGKKLLRACADEAQSRGAARLELTVDRSNTGASALYARLGAKDTGKSYLRWEGDSLASLTGRREQ
jgi:ribosomal protein S18 acetylase RimI-like enzyme